jgi:hypothetical protein
MIPDYQRSRTEPGAFGGLGSDKGKLLKQTEIASHYHFVHHNF